MSLNRKEEGRGKMGERSGKMERSEERGEVFWVFEILKVFKYGCKVLERNKLYLIASTKWLIVSTECLIVLSNSLLKFHQNYFPRP